MAVTEDSRLGQAHAPARTASIDAYSVYLKARQKLALRGAENLDEARALFQQAIELDPGYAPSYSGLARATELYWLYQSDYGYSRRTALDVTSTIGAVRAAAHSALGLDPDNAEALSVLGQLEVTFQGDWIEAGRGHERALALRPNDPEILNFAGDYYYWVQDPRALETEGRAVALDPMLSVNPHDLALALAAHGDFAQALASAERAEALGFYAVSPSLRSVSFCPDHRLTLLATDIEIQITTSSEVATGDGDGAVTVGARKLQEILRSLSDNSEVSLVLEDKRLQVLQARADSPCKPCRPTIFRA